MLGLIMFLGFVAGVFGDVAIEGSGVLTRLGRTLCLLVTVVIVLLCVTATISQHLPPLKETLPRLGGGALLGMLAAMAWLYQRVEGPKKA